jgi:hypothetical protein
VAMFVQGMGQGPLSKFLTMGHANFRLVKVFFLRGFIVKFFELGSDM